MITIAGGADLHEALVARSGVPKDRQELIFVKENMILLHHECHMDYGQTREMVGKCLVALCRAIGAKYVGRWYVSLWEKHGLSVPKGLLIPEKTYKVYQAMALLEYGRNLGNWVFPEEDEWMVNPGTQYARDYRALCINRWQGKTIRKIKRPPPKWAGFKLVTMVQLIWDGYYFDYLARALSFEPGELLDE